MNDDGELSLPTSNSSAEVPTSLYLYGSFNSWNAATALQFGEIENATIGFKYFTAGTQIKFLAAQNSNVIYGGSGMNGDLVLNGSAITIQNTGFYMIRVYGNSYSIQNINVTLGSELTMSYNVTGNYFYVTMPMFYNDFDFRFEDYYFGDNIADGNLDYSGAGIINPNYNVTHLVKVYMNFNTSGNYTIAP
ncbi:hypothetical protein [Flavobacterium sp. 3HN19-14]|uniref:hypothetical protein n=1 Tax=Flavobacterium sp. 3HN19-14 TaxID=3448133 RepID=UPI003EDE8738